MIAVLLDDYQREYKMTEPVVSGSYFVFPEQTGDDSLKLEFWQCHWFGWCETLVDGSPSSMDDKDPDWESECGWKYMQVFGRPLVEVTNERLLKERIIDPLLELIEQNSKGQED